MSREPCFYTELADIYMQLVYELLMFTEGLWAFSLVYYGLISFECQNLCILDVLVGDDFDIVHRLPLSADQESRWPYIKLPYWKDNIYH